MLSSWNAYFITCTLQIFQVKVNKNKCQWFGKLGIQLFVYLLKFLAHLPGRYLDLVQIMLTARLRGDGKPTFPPQNVIGSLSCHEALQASSHFSCVLRSCRFCVSVRWFTFCPEYTFLPLRFILQSVPSWESCLSSLHCFCFLPSIKLTLWFCT